LLNVVSGKLGIVLGCAYGRTHLYEPVSPVSLKVGLLEELASCCVVKCLSFAVSVLESPKSVQKGGGAGRSRGRAAVRMLLLRHRCTGEKEGCREQKTQRY
jgi:hypothetical protein